MAERTFKSLIVGELICNKFNANSKDPISIQTTVAEPTACAAMTATLTGVDTGTDMTTAQAGTIVTDLAACKTAIDANKTAIDALIARVKAVGLVA